MYRKNPFSNFAKKAAHLMGHPIAFGEAFLIIIVWAMTGPFFHYSDTWQLAINTGTTIVTFLMVFLIQNTQNRDSYAIQLKLDELVRVTNGAHNSLLDIEELTEDDLLVLKSQYAKLARQARAELRQGKQDINRPPLDNPIRR